ncbi:class Ib ribonucleoside-diphosphate reductase assembly flavoprotein NrdI [Brucella inopinata]|uniref:Protein NrdI n=1 Tax=Brucella inopinata TaxID=1218315 RepID=A0AAW7AYI4_9HYPH|nr:class Ib ribonucleoside-diphosphate reductase assembly flavoprotein NrdI [Brucella inopinata]EFM55762.1 nrdI protein [Brucella inopinata BO1]KEY05011.1 ribonucleotide reductase stimulatory protein [Brucella suis bv. 4 str. 40]MDL2331930.1 class Ib ribonucleoside-diphosphate reductase assembly flavoprotein NrdI [Brucella inopinata]
MSLIVYFSSRSGNTHRFVERLGVRTSRIPLEASGALQVREPFVLVTPTYGGGSTKGAVPNPVIRFLNDADNRALIRGVIAAGNSNFGEAFCIAGNIISAKCGVPYLYRFELLGTAEDVGNVRNGMEQFWTRQTQA